MTRTIAIHNQKGGVGKTTTTTNVGFELARKGFKTLLIDLDPQATLTSGLGVDNTGETIFSTLQDAVDGKEVRFHNEPINDFLSVVPSCKKMVNAEYLLQNEYGRENFLKELIGREKGRYDYILLDCPPAVGLITVNALVAATDIIIPLQPETASLYGLVAIMETISTVQKKINKELNVLGMLVTQYDKRTLLHKKVLEAVRGQFGSMVLDTVINRCIKVSEAMSERKDVATYSLRCSGAGDYKALTEEILKRMND